MRITEILEDAGVNVAEADARARSMFFSRQWTGKDIKSEIAKYKKQEYPLLKSTYLRVKEKV